MDGLGVWGDRMFWGVGGSGADKDVCGLGGSGVGCLKGNLGCCKDAVLMYHM